VIVVIAVVVVSVILTSGHPAKPRASASSRRSASASASASAPAQASDPSTQVTGVITDSGAHLSWSKLGGSWAVVPQKAGGAFDQYMALTTDNFTYQGKATVWAATVASGALGSKAGVAYTGPSSLPQAANGFLTNFVLPQEYFAGSKLNVLSRRAYTLDGSPAYLVRFTVSYSAPGLTSTQDTDLVVLVATGSGAPSVFQVGIPNNTGSLIAALNVELNSLRVTQ
jgi:hypothetical protein